MHNQWVEKNRHRTSYQWQMMVGENAIIKLKPIFVEIPQRPRDTFILDEHIRVIIPDFKNANRDLSTFLADCYLARNKNTKMYVNLKLIDKQEQPIEAWYFEEN